MRDCLFKDLNSLSLQKKNNIIVSQNYVKCQIGVLHWVSIRCSVFLLFLSCFILSLCMQSESFPSSSDCCCFFLPPLSFCHLVVGTEAQSQKWSSWIPFTWCSELQEQPACPELLPATLPLAALHLFYFPFFLVSKLLRFPSPSKYLGFQYDPPRVIISPKRHAQFWRWCNSFQHL